jgi:hypothetical protein
MKVLVISLNKYGNKNVYLEDMYIYGNQMWILICHYIKSM